MNKFKIFTSLFIGLLTMEVSTAFDPADSSIHKSAWEQNSEYFNRLYVTIGNIYSDSGEITPTPQSVTVHGFKKNRSYNKVCGHKPRSKLSTNFSILTVYSTSMEVLHKCFYPDLGLANPVRSTWVSGFVVDLPQSIDLQSIGSIHVAEVSDRSRYIYFQIPQPIIEATFPTIHDIDLKAFDLYGNNKHDKSYDIIILGEQYAHENNWPINKNDFIESDFGFHTSKAMDTILKSTPFKEKKQHLKFMAGVFKPKVNPTNVTLISPFRSDFVGILALEILFHLNGDQLLVIKNQDEQNGYGTFATIIPKNRLLEMPAIVSHELGHSIAGFVDEYLTTINEGFSGCNYAAVDTSEEMWFNPNMSQFKDRDKVPWKNYLKDSSPEIEITYPKDISIQTGETRVLEFKFIAESDSNKIVITGMRDVYGNTVIENHREVSVTLNGLELDNLVWTERKLPRDVDSGRESSMYFITAQSQVYKEDEISVKVQFENSASANQVIYRVQKFKLPRAVHIVSDIFDPKEIGIFNGGSFSDYCATRSSYVNLMVTSPYDFNRYQSDIIKAEIDSYLLMDGMGD